VALALDGLLLGLAGALLGAVFFDPLARLGAWGRLLGFGVALSYFGLLNSVHGRGQTLGKRAMGIRVADRAGEPIALRRSCVRFAVLFLPFFLNGLLLPPSVALGPVAFPLAMIVFGGGGALAYLALFNRGTRQSLHDLAVGSFVTMAGPGKPAAGGLWRPHLLLVDAWFVVVLGATVWMNHLSRQGVFPGLAAVAHGIQATGEVHTAEVNVGTAWRTTGVHREESQFLQINAILREPAYDPGATAHMVAGIALRNYPEARRLDVIAVMISYGYDIGIARGWMREVYQRSPSEWQAQLVEPSSDRDQSRLGSR
jgi:uncharacterized RDD family membrane protein YckC